MSREIKFRAWDDEKKVMLMPETSDLVIHFDGSLNSLDFGIVQGTRFTKQMPIMQYTGLHDRTGKEIYEGDIIAIECDCDPGDYSICNHPPEYAKVEWDKDVAAFVQLRADGKWGEAFEEGMCDVFENIGNIYEHPSLLTGGYGG